MFLIYGNSNDRLWPFQFLILFDFLRESVHFVQQGESHFSRIQALFFREIYHLRPTLNAAFLDEHIDRLFARMQRYVPENIF